MSRYPYTDAYDALRAQTEYKNGMGVTFSRSEAACVVKFIADALKMDAHDLVVKIADHAAGGGQ